MKVNVYIGKAEYSGESKKLCIQCFESEVDVSNEIAVIIIDDASEKKQIKVKSADIKQKKVILTMIKEKPGVINKVMYVAESGSKKEDDIMKIQSSITTFYDNHFLLLKSLLVFTDGEIEVNLGGENKTESEEVAIDPVGSTIAPEV